MILKEHGAQILQGAVNSELATLEAVLRDQDFGRPGMRIQSNAGLAKWTQESSVLRQALCGLIDAEAKPVRAVLFDKNPGANWSLGWHQDRTICVRQRIDAPSFGPWTIKRGLIHVEPPFQILSRMFTIRIHLDQVTSENAPLLVAPGSHLFGRIDVSKVEATVARCGTFACLAEAGDIWIYSTPILHASRKSEIRARRRVLQIDYSADPLPYELEWRGV